MVKSKNKMKISEMEEENVLVDDEDEIKSEWISSYELLLLS